MVYFFPVGQTGIGMERMKNVSNVVEILPQFTQRTDDFCCPQNNLTISESFEACAKI